MATHNGEKTLPSVLQAYAGQESFAGGWQLVVVDNASQDRTTEILEEFSEKLPLIHIHTDKRGKNVALNIGLDHLAGDLVVLTDDDAIPDTKWLSKWREIADERTDFSLFGGKIYPIWPNNLPEWIPRLVNLGATYAITPGNLRTGPVTAAQIWGPNMAVRADIFASGYRFNEDVGPQAGQYVMGSEVEFTCRLEKQGHRAWFDEKVVVGHIIRPNQIERKWIVQRAYRLGRHMFHQEIEIIPQDTTMFRGAPRWRYGRLVSEYFRFAKAVLTGSFDNRFLAEWEISFLNGYLAEAKITERKQSCRLP